ncbi:hypothetical protein LGN17_30940 [Burkholderia sp. AU30280]|nr:MULTISPECIES: hypothetical protein [Burkholderia]MCA8276902.1 hypothetical protein [Burkholderia sp. AU30280]
MVLTDGRQGVRAGRLSPKLFVYNAACIAGLHKTLFFYTVSAFVGSA